MPNQPLTFFATIPEFGPLSILDLGCRNDGEGVIYSRITDSLPSSVLGIDVGADYQHSFAEQFAEPIKTEYIAACLGDGHERPFFECVQETTSSLLQPDIATCSQYDGLAEAATITTKRMLKTVTLNSLLSGRHFDLIKSDLQGADVEVLFHGTSVLSSCCVLIIETEFISQYESGPHFNDVLSFLQSHGLMFHSFIDYGTRPLFGFRPEWSPVKRGYRQWLWANAVFVRQFSRWLSLDEGQLARFAAIMHYQLSAFDYSWRLLAMLDRRRPCASSHASTYLDFLSGAPTGNTQISYGAVS